MLKRILFHAEGMTAARVAHVKILGVELDQKRFMVFAVLGEQYGARPPSKWRLRRGEGYREIRSNLRTRPVYAQVR